MLVYGVVVSIHAYTFIWVLNLMFMGRLVSCCRVRQPTLLWSLCSLGVKKIKTPGSPYLSLTSDRMLWYHRWRSLQCATRYFLHELFRLLHLTRAPHQFIRLAAGARADLAWWWRFLKECLSSHVARQIVTSGQMHLAVGQS